MLYTIRLPARRILFRITLVVAASSFPCALLYRVSRSLEIHQHLKTADEIFVPTLVVFKSRLLGFVKQTALVEHFFSFVLVF